MGRRGAAGRGRGQCMVRALPRWRRCPAGSAAAPLSVLLPLLIARPCVRRPAGTILTNAHVVSDAIQRHYFGAGSNSTGGGGPLGPGKGITVTLQVSPAGMGAWRAGRLGRAAAGSFLSLVLSSQHIKHLRLWHLRHRHLRLCQPAQPSLCNSAPLTRRPSLFCGAGRPDLRGEAGELRHRE